MPMPAKYSCSLRTLAFQPSGLHAGWHHTFYRAQRILRSTGSAASTAVALGYNASTDNIIVLWLHSS